MKRIPVIFLMSFLAVGHAFGQEEQEGPQREVTLYNVYKPSLSESNKRSFLPVISDTAKITPDITYSVTTKPFYPEYKISPLKAATLQADPLPKLYKSYINLGVGNYYTPFGELSITNERSKKNALGFYARHFSTNGKVKLDNDEKVFAGYMDNDASIFGKKFFRNSILEGSIDYSQKTRYAYGFNTADTTGAWEPRPDNKDIKRIFQDVGATASYKSTSTDSSDLAYDINLGYDLFMYKDDLMQHQASFDGLFSKEVEGFYGQIGAGFDYYYTSGDIVSPEFTASLSPSVSKKSQLWNFKLGAKFVYDRDYSYSAGYDTLGTVKDEIKVYPDIKFGFSIMPTYMDFFLSLTGDIDKNISQSVITDNPYTNNIFQQKNTDYSMIATAGFSGNNGIGGNYLFSASYSMVKDMIFYITDEPGRYFYSVYDDIDLLNLHGEVDGAITDKLSFSGSGNMYKYNTVKLVSAPNKPNWDAEFGLKYNLRDKILAGVDVTAIGKRTLSGYTYGDMLSSMTPLVPLTEPVHVNLNFSAEYRYTKILSFWLKANNVGINRYNQYAYYPTQRFLFMLGFSYSL
jgi:hypothetical protein